MAPGKKHQEIEKDLEHQIVIPDSPTDTQAETSAKKTVAKESKFYDEKKRDELHQENVADRKSARIQRETYAGRVFNLVLGWIVAILLLLVLQGFGEIVHYKPLSDKVLLTLITSTTVNLIGTLIIVLKYIFRSSAHKNETE